MTDRTDPSPWRGAKEMTLAGETGIRWAGLQESNPGAIPAGIDTWDKVEGMLLGLAIGDALGNTTESMLPDQRHELHGRIDGYLPNAYAEGCSVGLPSDDTQLSFWTLEHLASDGRLDPQILGMVFSRYRIFGLGQSVRAFLGNFKSGLSWRHAGACSAGNGALMRVAPFLIPHLAKPGPELWGDVILGSHLTHRDGLSTACCLGFAGLLWEAISATSVPSSRWWLERFVELTRDVEPIEPYRSRGSPIQFEGRLTDMLAEHVVPALESDLPVEEACAGWYSGAYLLETVPTVLYILSRHGHDPERALLEAVNGTKDNDTIAAIVGAAVGAMYGKSALRREWIDGLLGRTGEKDDGKVFAILQRAARTFGFGESDYCRARAQACVGAEVSMASGKR